jgi:trk system potassium uptake protein TrkA
VIWPGDVIERYNTEIFKRDMASSMVSTVTEEHKIELVPAAGDTVVAEIPVPSQFIGKTIRELDIRRSFGVSVLMIKQPAGDGGERLNTTPDADYTFKHGDMLLIMGPSDELRHLKRGRPRAR